MQLPHSLVLSFPSNLLRSGYCLLSYFLCRPTFYCLSTITLCRPSFYCLFFTLCRTVFFVLLFTTVVLFVFYCLSATTLRRPTFGCMDTICDSIMHPASNVACGVTTTVVCCAARQQNSDKQRLVVYSKMVGIMGFTWAAGFLAAFTEVAAFWWVYIVLNGLQGTFIAFSFVLNARLLRFLKNKMSNTNAASGIDSKSRTQGTEWRIGSASAQQLAGERQHVHIGGINFRPNSNCGALDACLDSQKGDPDVSLSGLSGTSITVETNVDI